MKNIKKLIKVIPLISVAFLLLICFGCEEEAPSLPTVTTAEITDITDVAAKGGGEVTDDGGSSVTARGICWSRGYAPNLDNTFEGDDNSSDGSGLGEFTSSLTGLKGNMTYYVRAYATNADGTAYGNKVNFTTPASLIEDCNSADIWVGDNAASDQIWPGWDPSYCTGEKIDNCNLKLSFDIWGYGSDSEIVLKLKLMLIEGSDQGELTLMEDAVVTADGIDITFHAGPAGTYNTTSKTLSLDVVWSGYEPSIPSYKWAVTPIE
jgi:hypothetical protein